MLLVRLIKYFFVAYLALGVCTLSLNDIWRQVTKYGAYANTLPEEDESNEKEAENEVNNSEKTEKKESYGGSDNSNNAVAYHNIHFSFIHSYCVSPTTLRLYATIITSTPPLYIWYCSLRLDLC